MSARIKITCGVCGSDLPVSETDDAETVVESAETCPPFCVVCAGRALLVGGQPAEIWEEVTA